MEFHLVHSRRDNLAISTQTREVIPSWVFHLQNGYAEWNRSNKYIFPIKSESISRLKIYFGFRNLKFDSHKETSTNIFTMKYSSIWCGSGFDLSILHHCVTLHYTNDHNIVFRHVVRYYYVNIIMRIISHNNKNKTLYITWFSSANHRCCLQKQMVFEWVYTEKNPAT